jgi:hypothetical protein
MDDLGHWIGVLLLLVLHWLWSIREFLFFTLGFIGLAFGFKFLVSSAVEEALDKTVVPLLREISEQLSKQSDE